MEAIVRKISESGKSVAVSVKANPFCMESVLVYMPNNDYELGQKIEIPEGLKIVNWGDRTTKSGIPLKVFAGA